MKPRNLESSVVAGAIICLFFVDCSIAGIVCYNCNLVSHQRDCDVVTECGDHEVCYGEKVVTSDGIVSYRSGCKSKQACLIGSGLILGKRSTIVPCSKCCNTSYCNLESCDTHVQAYGTRCLFCPFVLTPKDCYRTIECNAGEICYSESVIHNHEKRYRTGCVPRDQCGEPNLVNGGHSSETHYCGGCCIGDNCNRDVCSSQGAFHLPLLRPLLQSDCRDNSTEYCMQNIHSCDSAEMKFFLCPYTCGQCATTTTTGTPTDSTPLKEVPTMTTMERPTTQYFHTSFGPVYHCYGDRSYSWNGHCYYMTQHKHVWDPKHCHNHHMVGVTVDTEEKLIQLVHFVRTVMHYVDGDVWLGGKYDDHSHRWEWKNGNPIIISKNQWTETEYNHQGCLILHGDKLASNACDRGHYLICEKPLTLGTPTASSTHYNKEPTTPVLESTTQSVLTSFGPVQHCSGERSFTWNGHCYLMTTSKHEWDSNSCHDHHMTRAIVDTEEKIKQILHFVRTFMHYSGDVWFGGKYDDHSHRWEWVNGNPIDIIKDQWTGTEYNHHGCLKLHGDKFESNACNAEHFFICEKRL